MFINSLLSTSLKQSLSCLILNYITVNNLIFFRDIIISAVPKTNIKHFAAKYVPLPDMLKKLKESEELTLSRLEYLEICCEVENANDKKMEEIMKLMKKFYATICLEITLIDRSKVVGEARWIPISPHICKHE
eukprot:TRINITY_DN7616_c0_g1_i5.p1 TRINITY_DN7616_c0_g1~~TRINITY_DN7616_c0_g1_i5.p1  ORF type:complete len:133 (+),score=18.06 TRINITY_DN7616_c0_g1_i5:99-497(+)